ncbi:MAG: amidohydrolase family protein, partial [Chloroflexi bacterium]|nr:amidohydrolase family protein [Chloroflexota bacterium]
QRRVFHTDVERSATEIELFQELQRRGDLSVRVYAHLSLPLWREAVAAGIRPRADDGRIRVGGMKGYIDGFFMDEPYVGRRDRGDFTFRFTDEATMAADVAGADAAGFDPVVHTIGDRAHGLLLDWLEAAVAQNAPRDRRFRVIHAWYPTAADIERIGRLGLLVDVTPQHVLSDAGSVEGKLGPARARTAHAWRSLADAGARIELVSDWPGSFNEQRGTPLAPLENIALAVTRAWHPEQRLSVEEAIVAYTRTPADASYEEDRKGTLSDGKLADLVVLSDDILRTSPERIRDARVDLTVLDGGVIFEREGA